MKAIYFLIAAKLISVLACIAGVVYLAERSKDGWGWLIFLAVIIASGTISVSSKED